MTVTFIWLASGIAVIIVLRAVIRIIRDLAKGLDFGLAFDASSDPPRQSRFLSAPPGTMPLSVRLSGTAYRWSERSRLQTDELFWKNFEDGYWKWDTAGRYAGSGLNPGHYFAFSPNEARSEILHHLEDERRLIDYEVLAIQGEIDNILDLTSTTNIARISKELQILNNPYDLLGQLVTAAKGGSYFTDGFGAYAYERGYSGILFFSARNIEDLQRKDLQSEDYYHEDDELIFKSFTFGDMYDRNSNRCLVIFDGAELLASISKYRVLGQATKTNPYYKADKSLILKNSLNYGAEYQAQRRLSRGCPEMLWGRIRCSRCIDRTEDTYST